MNSNTQIVIFSSGNQKETIAHLAFVLNQYNCQCTLWTELFTRQDEGQKYALLPALLKKSLHLILLLYWRLLMNLLKDNVMEL